MNSLQTYRDLKKMLCKELDEMTSQGVIRDEHDLEIIDKLTHSIKSVETIIAMNEAYGHDESGYYNPTHVRYSHHSLADRSNAQRRDSMGRYSRDSEMISELRELMANAKDDHTRAKFQRFIDDLEER